MKEDLDQLTRTVESIKLENAKDLEALAHTNRQILAASDQKHQLSLAAIDFWNDNCVYLTAEACQAFRDAFAAAHMHRDFLPPDDATREERKEASIEIRKNGEKIFRAGNVILAAVALPALAEVGNKTGAEDLES